MDSRMWDSLLYIWALCAGWMCVLSSSCSGTLQGDTSERTHFLYRTASVQGTYWVRLIPKVVVVERMLYVRMEAIRTTSL